MSTAGTFTIATLILATFFLLLRQYLLPLLIRLFSSVRVAAISPISVRGLEWRDDDNADSIVPTLRLERAGWVLGGCGRDSPSFIVLRVEGVSLRVKKSAGKQPRPKRPKKRPGRWSAAKNRFISSTLHLAIHHCSYLTSIVSVQILDIRIIFDDFEGIEVTLKEYCMRMEINFEDYTDIQPFGNIKAMPEIMSPAFERTNPLYSPLGLSPPASPLNTTSFAFPPPDSEEIVPRPTSMGSMRRRASRLQSGVSIAAVQVWSRFIARAHGSVGFKVTMGDFAVILPNVNPAHPNASTVSHKPSSNSLRSDSLPRSNSFVSMHSIHSLLRTTTPRYALPTDGGYEKLLVIEGRSTAGLSLGFGPKKGLLAEDTLKLDFNMGKLQTTMGAADKVKDMVDAKKVQTSDKPKVNNWSPTALPRIVMRALEGVSVSFSHINVAHHLAVLPSNPVSTRSSATDLTDMTPPTPTEADFFTISLDVSQIHCRISAADASNNERARNAFGINNNPESKVRGIGLNLDWQVIELQCLAPGEKSNEKSQLLAIRQADVSGFSSWRPRGWTRDEMLFSNDPNLALIVMKGNVNSVDVAADVQLLNELGQAWDYSRPRKEKKVPRVKQPNPSLPPRIRVVFEVGHIMAIVADRVSEHRTTLSLASEGFNIGCFTGFSDVIGRRRDKSSTKSAFKEEERLRARREATPEDYTQPESMWKPDVRRHHGVAAQLPDDLSISLDGNASLMVEPITLHMSLSGGGERDQKIYHLATIGRVHGTLSGEVFGRQESIPTDTSSLDPTSLVANLNVGIDHGVRVHLYEPAVLGALVAMGEAHSPPPKLTTSPKTVSLLDRLPAGVSARLSLGCVQAIVGHLDPNPRCKLGLIKGIMVESVVSLEYSYFKHKSQAAQSRHPLIANERRKLQLRDDITTQALAFHNHLDKEGGRAALMSATALETVVKPLFNVRRYMKPKSKSNQPVETPKPKDEDPFVGWDFRSKPKLKPGEFANNVPPLEISDTDQARRPLLKLPNSSLNLLIQQAKADSPMELKLTGKVTQTKVVCDLSHVYCLLLASLTVKAVVEAWKRPKLSSGAHSRVGLSTEISFPVITVHLALPLKEQVFFFIKGVTFDKLPAVGFTAGVEQVLAFVPSPRMTGSWEDLLKLKRISVQDDSKGEKAFKIAADAMSITVPTSYEMNRLILNLNVSIKASKLLARDLGGRGFETIMVPGPEAPKRIPKLDISIRHVALEAADNPIENTLGLISRAGMVEQEIRNAYWDWFRRKKAKMSDDGDSSGDEAQGGAITTNASTDEEDALNRLRWHISRSWTRRIKAAKTEQRRREEVARKHTASISPDIELPIRIFRRPTIAPLFRGVFEGFHFVVEDPGMSRPEIIDYMAKASTPFKSDVEFSLMVPTKFSWKMDSAVVSLRDYPLPLVRVKPVSSGDRPAWHVETILIVAEELADNNSHVLVPCPVILAGCGDLEAQPFEVQIAKTIMPVKTYARPHIKLGSEQTTEFTWGNSYQPAIQDFMKVIERLSHPPRDPSPRVGFWDKFRLVLHWKVIAEFAGPVHLHLKGSSDPYMVTGYGAGFALAWNGNTRLEIAQPNPQHETIQMSADELLIAIPDLTHLHDDAAMGNTSKKPANEEPAKPTSNKPMIEMRYTKTCAKFTNGVRVGFGFKLEKTCRPWNCTKCGPTENLMRRQCRSFDFKNHQEVVLKSQSWVNGESERIGRQYDSYEGFRSDFIHFSISLEAPDQPKVPAMFEAEKSNSLHFTPMAFAHFFAWWRLFDHTMSLPIQQGRLFPDSPPPSKKFGRSIATIKYRFNLAPVYISHMYGQESQDMWAAGKAQSLGIKARIGHFKADAHQRAQEKTVKHEKLHRVKTVTHKAFYAVDLILSDIKVKGLRVEFSEMPAQLHSGTAEAKGYPKASELPEDLQIWYNFLDFVDADRKPMDTDPRIEIVDIGDCPQISYCKRVKAKKATPDDNDEGSLHESEDAGMEVESSKFGHEKSHICYLGAAPGVADVQTKITESRISELEAILEAMPLTMLSPRKVTQYRLTTLRKYLEILSRTEKRHIDDDTFQIEDADNQQQAMNRDGEVSFQDTYHMHCPRMFFNNASRNIVFKYWYSFEDRKREAYTTSHTSLRGVREGIKKRDERLKNAPKSFWNASGGSSASDLAHDMLKDLTASLQDSTLDRGLFTLPADVELESDPSIPQHGLPRECAVKPKTRILVLKPQIALRSEVDVNAVVLLALEEISFKGFQILDTTAFDEISGDVLNRNYISLKGLQAFYPCEASLQRSRPAFGLPRGLDFVPLEIFLDVKSEAQDYDRIVLKTDISISMDKFNHLRLPRGLDWPDADDGYGQSIEHLRLHQDLTTVIIPRLNLTATSKHYTALYNVVTDLLMYQDPEHRHRAERIDSFIYAFDQKDRDTTRLLAELDTLQQTIRQLQRLQNGYEANVGLLNTEGKEELLKIRADLTQGREQLLTVFEAISANHARDDAKAAMKSSSRMDVRAGVIAWHMLADDNNSLIKLELTKTIFATNSNKDGSMDGALVMETVQALNGNSSAVFSEVLQRFDTGKKPKDKVDAMFSVCWSILAPVGGITIIRDLSVWLHPVQFRIERVVGNQIKAYIFNEATTRKKAKAEALAAAETAVGRARSNTSVTIGKRSTSPHSTASETANGRHDPKFTMVPSEDAAEMKRRAASNKTFLRISFASTGLVFSYKRDPSHHKVIEFPDCADLKFRLPELVYTDKVWAAKDIFDQFQRDVKSFAWSNSRDILSQVLKKTSLFRSKKAFKHLSSSGSSPSGPLPPSRLKDHVEATDADASASDDSGSESMRPPSSFVTPVTTPHVIGRTASVTTGVLSLSDTLVNSSIRGTNVNGTEPSSLRSVPSSEDTTPEKSDEEPDHSHPSGEDKDSTSRGFAKGLLGKLRKARRSGSFTKDSSGTEKSKEDLSRVASLEKARIRQPTSQPRFEIP